MAKKSNAELKAALIVYCAAMSTTTVELTLTAAADEPMTGEQAALLKELAHAAYDFEAYGPRLTKSEAARRIAALQAKLALQSEPPHTQ